MHSMHRRQHAILRESAVAKALIRLACLGKFVTAQWCFAALKSSASPALCHCFVTTTGKKEFLAAVVS